MLKAVLVTGCFSYCWAAPTQRQGISCFSHCVSSEWTAVHKEMGGDTARQVTSHKIWHHVQHKRQVKEGRRRKHSKLWCLSFHDPSSCFPGDRWISAWQQEAVNEFLVLPDLHARPLLSLLRCLYVNPWVFSLLAFWFSPPFTQGKWVSGCEGLSCRLRLNCDNHRLGKRCGPTARKKEKNQLLIP